MWRGQYLVGLAPLYLETGPLGRRLLPLGIGLSDAFDVLLAPEAAEEAGRVLVQAAAGLDGWEGWELEELPEDAAALTLPVPPGCTDAVVEQSASPVLGLSGSGPDALAVLPARKHRKLRMAQNRVGRRGGVVSEPEPGGIDRFLDELVRLHGARWNGRGQDGVLADEAVRRFHAAALPALAAAGLARLFTLSIEGAVVGAYYGVLHRERACAYLGGFDPDFAFESPGTVLIGHAVADAAARGARVFDFLRGQEGYKYEWGAQDRWSRRRTFRRAARG
ncbi:MAG: hypothetical protein JWR08_1531 [Enterovirga sp.]|nr:hypothetical protein [Enterovirga sp.]